MYGLLICKKIGIILKVFETHGGETYIVELEADLNERLLRNKTGNRK